MMRSPRRSKLFALFFVTLLAALSALLIVGVGKWTAPAVERAKRERLERVLSRSLSAAGESSDAPVSSFTSLELSPGATLLRGESGQYEALLVRGSGLWGPMEVVVLFNPESREVASVAVLEHEETPGIGSRISEADFLDRFRGASMDRPVSVESLSGATRSSRALEAVVETARQLRLEYSDGEAGETAR